jgi:hypothetical protein
MSWGGGVSPAAAPLLENVFENVFENAISKSVLDADCNEESAWLRLVLAEFAWPAR